jgi:hypothetical protein
MTAGDRIVRTVEIDLDRQGNGIQHRVPGGPTIGFRRYHRSVLLGVHGTATWLGPDDAEAIGIELLAAAEAMRRCRHGLSSGTAPNPTASKEPRRA